MSKRKFVRPPKKGFYKSVDNSINTISDFRRRHIENLKSLSVGYDLTEIILTLSRESEKSSKLS